MVRRKPEKKESPNLEPGLNARGLGLEIRIGHLRIPGYKYLGRHRRGGARSAAWWWERIGDRRWLKVATRKGNRRNAA